MSTTTSKPFRRQKSTPHGPIAANSITMITLLMSTIAQPSATFAVW